jgi:hypothetical protein
LSLPCRVANTASEAWKFKHSKRKTDRDDDPPPGPAPGPRPAAHRRRPAPADPPVACADRRDCPADRVAARAVAASGAGSLMTGIQVAIPCPARPHPAAPRSAGVSGCRRTAQ